MELIQWVMMARGIGDLEKIFWKLKFDGHIRLCAEIAFVLCNLYLDALRPSFVDDNLLLFAYFWMEESINLLEEDSMRAIADQSNRFVVLCGVSIPEFLDKKGVMKKLIERGLVL